MRTSLTETQRIEQFLFRQAKPEEHLLMEAEMYIDPSLIEKVEWQERTYQLIREYGRNQLRKEIRAVSQKLFSEPKHIRFQRKIRSIFKKH